MNDKCNLSKLKRRTKATTNCHNFTWQLQMLKQSALGTSKMNNTTYTASGEFTVKRSYYSSHSRVCFFFLGPVMSLCVLWSMWNLLSEYERAAGVRSMQMTMTRLFRDTLKLEYWWALESASKCSRQNSFVKERIWYEKLLTFFQTTWDERDDLENDNVWNSLNNVT